MARRVYGLPVLYDNPREFYGRLRGKDSVDRRHVFRKGTVLLALPAGLRLAGHVHRFRTVLILHPRKHTWTKI